MKRVHPSPFPTTPSPSSSLLSILPAALLALASTLSPDDQQVLAYLLGCDKINKDYANHPHHPHSNNSSNKNNKKKNKSTTKSLKNHPPELGCSCFGCYKSFWARWDSSPNRHVIHAILDAFEESLETKESMKMIKGKSKKEKHIKSSSSSSSLKKKQEDDDEVVVAVEARVDGKAAAADAAAADDDDDGYGDDEKDETEEEEEEEEETEGNGSVRRFVSWVFGINN